jgi:hypothetical protein
MNLLTDGRVAFEDHTQAQGQIARAVAKMIEEKTKIQS